MAKTRMTIDMSKQYRTRDGREVRIYATDGGGVWPVHGAVKTIAGGWDSFAWRADGLSLSDGGVHPKDLIEVKPRIRRTMWVNVFPGYCHMYTTRQNADHDNANRIACVEIDIDVEEGHGL